jgi:acetyl-CoA acyltransferase
MADVIVAGGVEHMSSPVLSDTDEFRDPWLAEHTDAYLPMGVSGENVARRYAMTRTELDLLAVQSNARAAAARENGWFAPQIVSVTGRNPAGEPCEFTVDEGIRPGTSLESLAGLKPAFAEDGLLTAATSSQRSDGAAFVALMSAARAAELRLRPLARLLGFAAAGVDPAYMGIGPIVAVPKVLAQTGLNVADLDVIELNEAFASQALAVVRDLGLDPELVNPNGGALAMGHPLGATGAILTVKALAELERRDRRLGLVTMCVGGGMGAPESSNVSEGQGSGHHVSGGARTHDPGIMRNPEVPLTRGYSTTVARRALLERIQRRLLAISAHTPVCMRHSRAVLARLPPAGETDAWQGNIG